MPTMKKYKFTSSWRNKEKREVEIVKHPNAAWFKALKVSDDRQVFRFSLLADGSLYFGDAFTVLHHDIMQWRGPENVYPIFIGVVLRVSAGPWRTALVQYFMEALGEPKRREYAKRLLGQLDGWKIACTALGENPFDNPPWGEDY